MSSLLTRFAVVCLVVLAGGRICLAQPGDVRALGAKGDGTTDDTDAVQAALDTGPSALFFPDGTYLLGTLKVPADTQITFAPRARLRINPQRIKDKVVLDVVGDRVMLDGVNFDFTALYVDEKPIAPISSLIRAQDVGHLRFTRLRAIKPSRYPPGGHGPLKDGGPAVIDLNGCHDVEIDRCEVFNVAHLATATANCVRVSVHENKAEYAKHIIFFGDNSQWLRHYSNWSSHVTYQCWWLGSDSNDTHGWSKGNTADLFFRGLKPGDQGYDPGGVGTYDIFIQNNYAEYGMTMCWGSKGKNVLIDGNIARYMHDYTFGSEGGINVVFSNNISINGIFGIAALYWSESLLVTGNQLLVLDQGGQGYQNNFMMLQGPGKLGNFGAGKAHISGNLFVNEVRTPLICGWSNEPWPGVSKGSAMRMVVIESCRDVNISGNKFVNGGIGTIEHSGRVVIANNDFELDFPYEPRCITLRGGMVEGIVRNNVFRRVPRMVVADDDGKATPAADVERGAAMPKEPVILALAIDGRARTIEGNYADGWTRGIMCYADIKDQPARFIVRNNTLSGDVSFVGPPSNFRRYVGNNLSTATLQLIDARPLDQSPIIANLFDHDCGAGRPNHGKCGTHGPGCDMRRYRRTIGGIIEPIFFPEPKRDKP